MNKLFIEGVDYTNFATGLDKIKETVSEKDGAIAISQTSEITLFGQGYNYWKSKILDDTCNAINKEFDVKVWYSNCKKQFDYILKAQGVSFDNQNCIVKLNLNAKNPNDERIEILKRHVFWKPEEGFLEYVKSLNRIPKLLYVKEFTFLSISVLVIYFILRNFITFVLGAFAIALAILDILGVIDIGEFKGSFEDDIIGAGEFSPAFYLNDIFDYWAKKAGLTFQSSILTGDYEFLAIWAQQYRQGIELEKATTEHWQEENLVDMTPLDVLNSMQGKFNTKFVIVGDKLILERKTDIDKLRKELFNLELEQKAGRIVDSYEVTFDNQTNYARFKGDYKYDSIDTQGNRSLELYRDYVEWNPGALHKNRKGDLIPDGIYGGSRFTADAFKNKFNSWVWDQAGSNIFSVGDFKFTHSLVLTNDVAQNPKLLIIDQNYTRKGFGTEFNFVVKQQIDPYQGGGIFESGPGRHDYNKPMWFSELYPKFWAIDDPNNHANRVTEINSLKWRPENFCDTVDFLKENGLLIKISSNFGDGNISSYEIDYDNCVITLTDIKFKCDGSKN